MQVRVIDMPGDMSMQHRAAASCVDQWRGDFPHDTQDWYLDLYREASMTDGVPVVLVATNDDEFLGTASLIADDELPGATEPGPWLAAVYVVPEHRSVGVGTRLVREMMARVSTLGIKAVYLYTDNGARWYEAMGWRTLREAQLSGHAVTVMTWSPEP